VPPHVQLFVTCLIDGFFPHVGEAVVDVLERAGVTVDFPADQTCCGQPPFNAGFPDESRRIVRHMLNVLDATEGTIVVPSGSCADMIINHAPELLAGDELASKAERVAARTRELTTYLVEDLGLADLGARLAGSAAYHPSCHGLRNLGIRHQPEQLLDEVAGLDRCPVADDDECCGFGGLFSVEMPALSAAMMERKLDALNASGADVVVGIDVGCLMHLEGGQRKRGGDLEFRHIAEVLAGTEEGTA
jgi:L-lactate dehydrogenase complex protein LldE